MQSAGRRRFSCGFDAADLALAGQEYQHAAGGFGDSLRDQIGCGGFQRKLFSQRTVEPAGFDRESAAIGGDDRGIAKHRGDRCGVERGGHDKQDQVVAKRATGLPCQGKAEIGIERAFVELVEDHRADARKRRVRLDYPGEDAFGDDLDPGRLADLCLAPDPVADSLADRLAQTFGHALGGGAGGQAAGFEHYDPALGQPRLQHRQRHYRGFTSARWGLQHGAALGAEGVQKSWHDVGYRQVGQGHARLIRDPCSQFQCAVALHLDRPR